MSNPLQNVQIGAIVFDAYGTLFDVSSVETECDRLFPGRGKELSQTWRQKQLEYSWLRSLMNRYVDFDQVTSEALTYSLQKMGLSFDEQLVRHLSNLYLALPPHPEVPQALSRFLPRRLVILSNGTKRSLTAVVDANGLWDRIGKVLSADASKIFKPYPSVYQLAVDELQLPKEQILFVSSNGWDVAGAKSFGFHVAWVNRTGQPLEQLGQQPDVMVKDLLELSGLLEK